MLTILTSADGFMVAGCDRLNPLMAHGLQESKRMLPLPTFLTSTDCCIVADGVRCPNLALFEELQRERPPQLTGADRSAVTDNVNLHLVFARFEYAQRLIPAPLPPNATKRETRHKKRETRK